jgi:hypothetical protein
MCNCPAKSFFLARCRTATPGGLNTGYRGCSTDKKSPLAVWAIRQHKGFYWVPLKGTAALMNEGKMIDALWGENDNSGKKDGFFRPPA